MHVLFVAPHFPAYQKQFVRALKAVGAHVTGIGEAPVGMLPDDLKSWLDGYEQVSNVCDENQMYDTVRRIQNRGWVDRMEATIEAHMLTAARVREACKIPGLSYEQTVLCRDKTIMKEFMRKHGIPCAQSEAAATPAEVKAFADRVGYPIILKPRGGAGAASTWRVNNESELDPALVDTGVAGGHSVALEEFIEGHEGFYDTLTVGGQIAHDFVSHYYPNVLEAMRTRWISPVIITTNRMNAPGYDELKSLGRKVIGELGLHTAPTHMEWFYGPKGLKFSEIGARPPGVGQWDLYCAANDVDLYKEWAFGIVKGACPSPLSRNYSAAIITLRPNRDGHIQGYQGLDLIEKKYGKWIIKSHIPPVGAPTQPVEAGYMANMWIQIKYPDYDDLRAILEEIGETVQVIAG
ncbi:MAG: ATP-grasp domain-containing protein [Acidobacteriota bacterium]|nr:ATP-grasp domain-containing protein [Acidobacteriota bacterium]